MISKSRIVSFLSSANRRYAKWHIVFDCIWNGAHEGRLVDTEGHTVYYWDIDPNGWLCICGHGVAQGEGACRGMRRESIHPHRV